MRRRLVVLAACAASVVPRAEQPPEQIPLVFRVTTEVVQFDATVIDADGRPVTTLQREDFVVLQDGKPVELTDVTFVDRRARSAAMARDPNRTPVLGVDVDPLVFLIDDMAMTPDGFHRVRRALREFVLAAVPAGVEIGILRTGEAGRRTTALTADRDELLRRIDGMRYLARSLRRGLASGSGAAGPGTKQLERTFLEGTLGSLNSLLADLRRFPGRKTVVLLSEGVAVDPGIQEWPEPVENRLNRLAQLAAEAGVTTHSVDITGVGGAAASLRHRMLLRDGLGTIAERMGGLYLAMDNDLVRPLQRIAAIESGYYVLSYVPPDGTFVRGRNAPFRKLTVRVHRDGLTVRTRAGFFGNGAAATPGAPPPATPFATR